MGLGLVEFCAVVLFVVGVIIVVLAGPEHISRKHERNVLALEEA
jgi:hypothetical protein